jgi:methylglutaconyl-CoA hydratase
MDFPGGYECLELLRDGDVSEVWLNRAQVSNAINPRMIAELRHCFTALAAESPRVVILGGNGKHFCAGADLQWMQSMSAFTPEENLADALRLADMLQAVDACPCPVVARVQGGAFGGGAGLLACCDTVIAATDARFAFSEVRLGLSPATITPYVVAKIGLSRARDLFLSGERFTADQAVSIGLVHFCIPERDLDNMIEAKVAELLMAGPKAAAATKRLLRSLAGSGGAEYRDATARLIADLRVSPEGQEGVGAFLAKRKPRWQD